jgi:hypothetical protein
MSIRSPNVTNIQISLDGRETPPDARKSDEFGRNTPVGSQQAATQPAELMDTQYVQIKSSP